VESLALIIDPPYKAKFDVNVARKWVEELEGLATKGYDVSKYMVKAKQDLLFLEKVTAL
jgi:hypothetical protein